MLAPFAILMDISRAMENAKQLTGKHTLENILVCLMDQEFTLMVKDKGNSHNGRAF